MSPRRGRCPRCRAAEPPLKGVKLFELDKLPHAHMDTFDFVSIPLGLGGLSFREKQLEYFATEEDHAGAFDVVLNTSMTWPSRSWPLEHWQRLATALASRGQSVAVVGKEVTSHYDHVVKRSHALEGCTTLVDRLSLDQTFYTIRKARVFRELPERPVGPGGRDRHRARDPRHVDRMEQARHLPPRGSAL
jgi:hypothetical protein